MDRDAIWDAVHRERSALADLLEHLHETLDRGIGGLVGIGRSRRVREGDGRNQGQQDCAHAGRLGAVTAFWNRELGRGYSGQSSRMFHLKVRSSGRVGVFPLSILS